MAAPTLVSSYASTSNTTTTTSAIAAAAGDLAVFMVANGETSVTATIGATSSIAADQNLNDGTRYHRYFSKVVVSGDLSGGTITATASAHSTGTVRRIALYIFRHGNGWSTDATARQVGADSDTTTGTSDSLSVTDTQVPSIALAMCTQASTPSSPGHTYAWDGAAAGNSDNPGGSNTSAWSQSARPGTVNTTGYDTSTSGEAVVIAGIGSAQNRITSLVAYRVVDKTLPAKSAWGAGRTGPAKLATSGTVIRYLKGFAKGAGNAGKTLPYRVVQVIRRPEARPAAGSLSVPYVSTISVPPLVAQTKPGNAAAARGKPSGGRTLKKLVAQIAGAARAFGTAGGLNVERPGTIIAGIVARIQAIIANNRGELVPAIEVRRELGTEVRYEPETLYRRELGVEARYEPLVESREELGA